MTKVISYANVQIKYNADTTGLKAHRTDLAAMTRLLRSGETEGEKFVRRIEMISRMSASNKKTQEEVAAATKIAADQLLAAARSSGRYLEALRLIETVAPNAAVNTRELANAFKAEQQAAKDAADAAAAKKRLMADYAMDTVAAKREVKARQDAERAAAQQRLDDIRRNQEMEAAIAKEHVKNVIAEQDRAQAEAERIRKQNEQEQLEDIRRRQAEEAVIAKAYVKQVLEEQDKAQAEADRMQKEADKQRLDDIRRRQAEEAVIAKAYVKDVIEEQDRALAQAEQDKKDAEAATLADIRRRQEIEAKIAKQYVDDIIADQDREAAAKRKAQREAQQLTEQAMTTEEKRSAILRKLKADLDKARISQEEYNRAVKATNTIYSQSPAGTGKIGQFAGGFASGLTPFGFGAGALGLAAGAAAAQGIRDSITAYMDMRDALVRLEVVLGSATDAKIKFEQFRQLSTMSSIDAKAITQSALTMAQFGVENEKLLPTMQRLTEISAGNAERLQSLALAFGQVRAAGRLTGQETLQFVNAGFSPLAEISRVTGESMASLRKRMEAGAVSVNEVATSFITATEAGGRFYGMNEKRSEELRGQLAKLSTEYTKFKEAVGSFSEETNIFGFLEDFIETMTEGAKGSKLILQNFKQVGTFGPLELAAFGNKEQQMRGAIDYAMQYATGATAETRKREFEERKAKEEQAKVASMFKLTAANVLQAQSAFSRITGAINDNVSVINNKESGLPFFGKMIKEGAEQVQQYKEQRKREIKAIERSVMTQEELAAAEAKRLGLMVRRGEISMDTAAKALSKQLGDKDTLKTDLPAAVSLGTKEAYELINRAENDIRTRQLQEQRKQVTLQEATNKLLEEIKNKPALGVMK